MARLEAITDTAKAFKASIDIVNEKLLIGRHVSGLDTILLPQSWQQVSGRHCEVFCSENQWKIKDLSRNGTVVNDEKLGKDVVKELRGGETIAVSHPFGGDSATHVMWRFVLDSNIREPPSQSPSGPPKSALKRKSVEPSPKTAKYARLSEGGNQMEMYKENSRLRKQVEDLNTKQKVEINKLRQEADAKEVSLQKRIDSLQIELAAAERKAGQQQDAESENDAQEQREQLEALKGKLYQAESALTTAKKELEAANTTIATTKGVLAENEAALEVAKRRAVQREERCNKLQDQQKRLEEKIVALSSQTEKLHGELREAKLKAGKAEDDHQQVLGVTQSLQNDLSAKSAIINDVLRDCSSVRQTKIEATSLLQDHRKLFEEATMKMRLMDTKAKALELLLEHSDARDGEILDILRFAANGQDGDQGETDAEERGEEEEEAAGQTQALGGAVLQGAPNHLSDKTPNGHIEDPDAKESEKPGDDEGRANTDIDMTDSRQGQSEQEADGEEDAGVAEDIVDHLQAVEDHEKTMQAAANSEVLNHEEAESPSKKQPIGQKSSSPEKSGQLNCTERGSVAFQSDLDGSHPPHNGHGSEQAKENQPPQEAGEQPPHKPAWMLNSTPMKRLLEKGLQARLQATKTQEVNDANRNHSPGLVTSQDTPVN